MARKGEPRGNDADLAIADLPAKRSTPEAPLRKLTKREREDAREERLFRLAERLFEQPSALALLAGVVGGVALYYPSDFIWKGTEASFIGVDPGVPRIYRYRVHLTVDNMARAASIHLPIPFTQGTADIGLPDPRDVTILVTRVLSPPFPQPSDAEIITEAQIRASLLYSLMGVGTGAGLVAIAGSLSTLFRK